MKRIVLLTLFLAGAILLHAQSEAKADTLDVPPAPAADAGSSLLPSTVKSYGGFLLDMGAMNLPERPSLSNFKLTVPDASKDYSFLLRPQTDAIYSQSTWPMFASPYYGFWDTPTTLQMRSVRLKNAQHLRRIRCRRAARAQSFGPALAAQQLQGGFRAEVARRLVRHPRRSAARTRESILIFPPPGSKAFPTPGKKYPLKRGKPPAPSPPDRRAPEPAPLRHTSPPPSVRRGGCAAAWWHLSAKDC